MGLFRRSASESPSAFWRTPPFRAEPSVLYQHGIERVGRGDGRGMMQTGWAIWQQAGLHEHQALDFLRDGYRQWATAGADTHLQLQFLTNLFDELNRRPAPGRPDAASAHFGALSWAGAELLTVAADSDQALYQRYELEVLDSISAAPRDFVPPRSMALASDLARKHGRPDPFPY